jgi:signal peptidase II
MIRVLGIALITLLVDQISKTYVVQYLNLKEKLSIDVINPFLNFRMAWNKGINFGLFSSGGPASRIILVTLSICICAGLLWWVRNSKDLVQRFFVALIIGGALGNALDRVIFGAVVDFLNMSCCGLRNPFSFNVADIAIFVGAFALLFYTNNDNEIN